MIRQHFYIPKYDWDVFVYYAVTTYYVQEITSHLQYIGCEGDELDDAYANMSAGTLNTGICYSSPDRKTVMVIALTSTPDEFNDTLDHEKNHLARHIEQYYRIDRDGEEDSYLRGGIAKSMFPVAKQFLCEHCRNNLRLQVFPPVTSPASSFQR